ncbi:MAG: hypothetical protein ACRC80_39565, partial [Waterburya sp.]
VKRLNKLDKLNKSNKKSNKSSDMSLNSFKKFKQQIFGKFAEDYYSELKNCGSHKAKKLRRWLEKKYQEQQLQQSSALCDTNVLWKSGTIISFECLGDIPGFKYLVGRTANGSGSVGLAPNLKEFTGTEWRVEKKKSADEEIYYRFCCLGKIPSPEKKYLDGRTANSSVGLAPNLKEFTGTGWRVEKRQSADKGIYYTFYCLGDSDQRGFRFLDGKTADGSVGLVESLEGFTGTWWRIRIHEK